jgi:RNA polymerase sigma factor (sigma-70 family)
MEDKSRIFLWKKFKIGDEDALTQLYKKYSHQMYSYGLRISNDKGLVHDCIQDVFIQLIDRRKKIDVTSSIHIYLFKSLRNRLFAEFRSNNRKQNILENISKINSDFEPNAEQILIRTESERDIKTRLGKLIEGLPPRQREIIYLKFTENMNYDEIAELLQIDNASARKLLYRALKTIKEQEEFIYYTTKRRSVQLCI